MTLRHKITAALMATVVLTALAAPETSADTIKSEGGQTVSMSGKQSTASTLKTTVGSGVCKNGSSAATGPSGVTTISLTLGFSNCTCIGIGCAVETNGCTFLGHIGAGTTGTVDIVCPAGQEITAVSAKCIMHIPPQTGLNSITFSNTGSGATREISLSLNISNIKYMHTKVAEGIGSCTTGTGTTGTLTGTSIATAVVDGGSVHVGIFVE